VAATGGQPLKTVFFLDNRFECDFQGLAHTKIADGKKNRFRSNRPPFSYAAGASGTFISGESFKPTCQSVHGRSLLELMKNTGVGVGDLLRFETSDRAL